MNIFDPTKSLIENLNYLSGPIIALMGFAAIIQLWLAKKAIVTTSKRQAAELATKQIDKYAEQIIPLQNKHNAFAEKLNQEKLKFPEIKEFTLKEIEKEYSEEVFLKNIEIGITNLSLINPVLNAMDTFATYFIKGVADEEIAFSSIGVTFCYSTEQYFFHICMARSEDDSIIYNNLVSLYHLWNPRLRSEKLNRELERKKQEIRKIKVSKIDPMGTK